MDGKSSDTEWGFAHTCEAVAGRASADHILGGAGQSFGMMLERALSRQAARRPLASLQLAQQRIAEIWIEIEQFRLNVLRTAWLVRAHISAVKAKILNPLPDATQPAMNLHGALGISNEMPFTEMIVESAVMALADGRTEVHRSHSPASTPKRMHDIGTTDLVTVEAALDRTGRLATC
jgi:alkylation response protein AidB-like acyl-CoA dehydrogenase